MPISRRSPPHVVLQFGSRASSIAYSERGAPFCPPETDLRCDNDGGMYVLGTPAGGGCDGAGAGFDV